MFSAHQFSLAVGSMALAITVPYGYQNALAAYPADRLPTASRAPMTECVLAIC